MGASQVALVGKNLPANAGDLRGSGLIPGSGRSPGRGNGNHSSVLVWRIPWTGEPGGLCSTGLQRVRQDCSNLAQMHRKGMTGGELGLLHASRSCSISWPEWLHGCVHFMKLQWAVWVRFGHFSCLWHASIKRFLQWHAYVTLPYQILYTYWSHVMGQPCGEAHTTEA